MRAKSIQVEKRNFGKGRNGVNGAEKGKKLANYIIVIEVNRD